MAILGPTIPEWQYWIDHSGMATWDGPFWNGDSTLTFLEWQYHIDQFGMVLGLLLYGSFFVWQQ